MKVKNKKRNARLKRKARIRKKVHGATERMRLTVFRSSKHIYAQVIDDDNAQTVVAASSIESAIKDQLKEPETIEKGDDKKEKPLSGKMLQAKMVGKTIAKRALDKGVKNVVFDRNGFLYHGRVRAVSQGAREAGLIF